LLAGTHGIDDPARARERLSDTSSQRRPAPARHDRHGGLARAAQIAAGGMSPRPRWTSRVRRPDSGLAQLTLPASATDIAVLLITHDLHLVRRFADRVAVTGTGSSRRAGPGGGAVFADPQHAYTRQAARTANRCVTWWPLSANTTPASPQSAASQANTGRSVAYPTPQARVRGLVSTRARQFAAKGALRRRPVAPRRDILVSSGESGSGKSNSALAAHSAGLTGL